MQFFCLLQYFFHDNAFFASCHGDLYTYFLFALTEKWTCQSKGGKCSLTSENSLFKSAQGLRAVDGKCLNTEWSIYENRGNVVLHSEEALHPLRTESGNVDLYALPCAHTYVHVHTHTQTDINADTTRHIVFLRSHNPTSTWGDVISNNYRWPLPVPCGCYLWASRDDGEVTAEGLL